MRRVINSWFSPNLNREMGIAAYGHYGVPLLLFPTAAADFLEYERFLMIDAIAPFIEGGKVKVYSINSINKDSWLNPSCPPRYKGLIQVAYNNYITEEVVPYIWNDCKGRIGIITCGASLGAFHAANQLFRRPDLFDGMIAMSGVYDIREYYDSHGYHDDNIYFNNVAEYLPGLNNGPYLPLLRSKKHIYILSGQGEYENPDASRWLSALLSAKGIPHTLDLWGYDMRHDWPTWRAMLPYYLATRF